VRIYSEPRLGTTITVLLPVTKQPPSSERPSSDEVTRGGGELVLLVADEPALREMTRRMLTRNGYSVITAANGQEAIKAATACQSHIAVLLTDAIMPGMQGKEVAERIREVRTGIAVLFMSGYTQGLLSAQGVLEPGINLLEKPFNQARLLKKLDEVLHVR
jgi:two-component system cell cycle sensor histidine kinase/response regulator CckA